LNYHKLKQPKKTRKLRKHGARHCSPPKKTWAEADKREQRRLGRAEAEVKKKLCYRAEKKRITERIEGKKKKKREK